MGCPRQTPSLPSDPDRLSQGQPGATLAAPRWGIGLDLTSRSQAERPCDVRRLLDPALLRKRAVWAVLEV